MTRATLLVPTLALLAAAPAHSEAALPEDCRRSALYGAARSGGGVQGQDLDGDRIPDLLRVSEQGCGATGCGTTLTLRLSDGPLLLTVDAQVSLASLLNPVPVPPALLRADRTRTRALVGASLFEVVCEGPDASLAWLLDAEHTLAWRPGPPGLPFRYAVLSTDARLRKLASSRAGAASDGVPEAVWIEYLGASHGTASAGLAVAAASGAPGAAARTAGLRPGDEGTSRAGPTAPEGSAASDATAPAAPPPGFRELARRERLVLLGTAHGVVLRDEERDRSAWIYVQPGGQKLSTPTIARAAFDGDEAVVEIDLSQASKRGTARIRLSDGHVETRACAADQWDAAAHACRAP